MKILRIVNYTGKNLNHVFNLPCVKSILKCEDEPLLILWPDLAKKRHIVMPGDRMVEYTNGKWDVEK